MRYASLSLPDAITFDCRELSKSLLPMTHWLFTGVVYTFASATITKHAATKSMAKILTTAIVADIRNKLNGSVFSKNRYGAYVRTKVTPVNPQTDDTKCS